MTKLRSFISFKQQNSSNKIVLYKKTGEIIEYTNEKFTKELEGVEDKDKVKLL